MLAESGGPARQLAQIQSQDEDGGNLANTSWTHMRN
jgi:hypothetical protein